MGRGDTGQTFALRRPPSPRPGSGGATTPGDDRSTFVVGGEITSPRAWPRTESPGAGADMFGQYIVHEQLGVGGMATVHRAERRIGRVRQRVALKRLLPHAADDPDLVKLFLDEARLVSTLRHRNIAEIYDAGHAGSDYFLAMELVAGPTLKHLMRHCKETVGLIPFPIILNLLTQVCDALAYAHDHCDAAGKPLGIVHRDVSPSNIVISSNGVAKLIDFGVAKTVTSNTQAGIIKGKLGYIAPEYLEGALDRRADLWAIGVVAYELLTNRRLFHSENDIEMLQLIRSGPIDAPSLHNPDVPPELDAIVLTALERDPDRRWQNATAMRNALAGCGRASTNAEVVEWVEFVFDVVNRTSMSPLRPVRGSRPLRTVQERAPRVVDPIAVAPAAWQLPLRPPTPTPPVVMLAPKLEPTVPVGAAMLKRRRRVRILVPLLLMLLGGVASALAVPYLWDYFSAGL